MLPGMHRTAARHTSLALALVMSLLAGLVPPAVATANVVPSPTVTSERLAGADRYGTAAAISQRLFPTPPAPVVYLASGENFPDALTAAPIAARGGGVLLFTKRGALPAVVPHAAASRAAISTRSTSPIGSCRNRRPISRNAAGSPVVRKR